MFGGGREWEKIIQNRHVLTKRHRLIWPAFSAVYRNSFAAKVIREPIGLVHAGYFGLLGEVYRLAHRRVTVLLEAGLHTDMPFRGDVISAFEDFSDFSGNRGYCLNTAGFKRLLGNIFAVKPPFCGNFAENRVCLEQFFT